jgi:hypothetical protein
VKSHIVISALLRRSGYGMKKAFGRISPVSRLKILFLQRIASTFAPQSAASAEWRKDRICARVGLFFRLFFGEAGDGAQ